jgi:cell division transport system permease protein
MRKKQYKPSNHRGLQAITLCISTAMVLILLGLVIFSVLMGRNLSSYVKENLVVQVMLEQDMTSPGKIAKAEKWNIPVIEITPMTTFDQIVKKLRG